jgi:transcriptional regulator with XRE-family HTH domain
MGSGGAAPEPFGAHLRRRRAAGLTQEGLAERAGLSARGVSDLERGARRAPQRETVRRLARSLRLRPAWAASRAMSPEQALADALEEHGVG